MPNGDFYCKFSVRRGFFSVANLMYLAVLDGWRKAYRVQRNEYILD